MQFDRDENRYTSVADRRERGKKARKVSPRSAAGAWEPPADRRDPVGIIEEGTKTAIPSLVQIRYGQMSASPFTFYRGTAAIMAALGVLLWLLRADIAAFYTSDAELLVILPMLFGIVAFFLIPDGGQVVMTFALRGAGDAWAPTSIHLMSFFVVMIPAAWILAFPMGLGVIGLVISIALGASAALVALSLRFWLVSARP